ncbi:MAG: sugar phosphate isomerase/epimerase [Clostridia bacterium]|nr:sugar phosphate isomerase/epimerase [Clostridia bacterium]
MKLVTQTEILSERFGDEAAVKIICESGFDGIDYSMFCMSDDNDFLNTPSYKNHVKEIRKIAESYSVTFDQSHAPFPPMREGDEEYSRKTMEKVKRALEISGILGSKICVVHPCVFSENQFERNMEMYHTLEPYAGDYGVKIAIENMWGWSDSLNRIVPNVCSTADDFNRYVDAVNPEFFTACLDLGHCGLVGDDAASMIRDMGSRLGCLHIHDNDNIHDTHTLPYLSKMDWDSILKALADIDYAGNFTYEADGFLRMFPDSMLVECEKFMCGIGREMIKKINEYKGN